MSRESQLEKALKKLREGGKEIGEPTEWNCKPAVRIDGVLMSEEQIFAAAEISPQG